MNNRTTLYDWQGIYFEEAKSGSNAAFARTICNRDRVRDVHFDWDGLIDNQYLLALMPRESLKTTLFVESYITKAILDDPEVRIALVTDTYKPHATQRVKAVQRYLMSDAAEIYCPGIHDRIRRGSFIENEIYIPPPKGERQTKEPNLIAAGIESPLTGGHFDYIGLDDVVNEKDKYSQTIRDKKRDWFAQLFDLAEPHTKIHIIGTRWHPQDLYQHIINEYADYFFYFRQPFYNPDGTLWLPEFYESRLGLLQKKPIHYSHQYLNEPIAGQDAQINLEWFTEATPPARQDFLKVIIALDPAYGEKESTTGCYNAGAVMALDTDRNFWLLDGFLTRDSLEAVNKEYLPRLVTKWSPDFISVENNGPQKGAELFFRAKWGNLVRGTSAKMSRDKLGRAQPWINYIERNGANFVNGEWWSEASYQLDLFPIGDFNDFPDAISVGWPELAPITTKSTSMPSVGGRRTVPGTLDEYTRIREDQNREIIKW